MRKLTLKDYAVLNSLSLLIVLTLTYRRSMSGRLDLYDKMLLAIYTGNFIFTVGAFLYWNRKKNKAR